VRSPGVRVFTIHYVTKRRDGAIHANPCNRHLDFSFPQMRVEEPEALLIESAEPQCETHLPVYMSQRWAATRTASLTAAWAAKQASA
jgi:hypothetical protein